MYEWNMYRGWFDGGRRSASVASCGWLIRASYESSPDAAWYTIVSASVLLPTGTTTVNAELTGAAFVTTALCNIARDVCNEPALPKQAKFRKLAVMTLLSFFYSAVIDRVASSPVSRHSFCRPCGASSFFAR